MRTWQFFTPFFAVLLFISCANETKEMRFSSWQSSPTEERLVRASLEGFEKAYPAVNYAYQPIPGNYTEKMQLMLGTGKAPDLFWLKGDTSPAYLSFDVLQPLDELLAQDPSFDVDDFFPVFKDAFRKDGNYYGFGKDFNAYVLFYNKKMFVEAGLDTIPTNWDELKSFAKKLTRDTNGDGKVDQYGLAIDPTIDMVFPFVYQNEGEMISDDGEIKVADKAFVEALEFYVGMYRDGVATIPADQGAGWNGDVFGRKQAAMVVSGGWLIPYLKESFPAIEYGIAELPKGKVKATVAFCNAYVIPKQSKHQKDAWTLLSYMAGKEGMKIWTSSGIAMPTRKSVAEENGFYEHPVYSIFMRSADYAKMYKINMKERWFDESEAMMQSVFYKDREPKEALEALAKRLERFKLN